MPNKRIGTDYLEEEQLNLESTGRYRVIGHRRAPGDPGVTLLKFRPVRRIPRPVKPVRDTAHASGRIEYSRSRTVARRTFNLLTPASRKPARAIAERWLRVCAPEFGIKRSLAGLRFDQVTRSIFGQHAPYQQHVGCTPISGEALRRNSSLPTTIC